MTPRVRGVLVGAVSLAVMLTGCASESAPLVQSDEDDVAVDPNSGDLSAGESDPVTDPFYPEFGNADIDVLHYDLDLSYEPSNQVLTGTATLTIRPVVDAAEVAVDLAKPLMVSKVTVDDVEATFQHEQYDLVIDTAVTADQPVVARIEYSGVPQTVPAPAKRGDMSMGIGASTNAVTGALWSFQEPFGALTWYPVNDHPSDEALYDIAITVPDGYSGVASGKFVGQEGDTFHWTSSDPVASYVTTIAVDQYELTELTGPNGLPITLWTLPEYSEFMPVLERMPDMIEWLESRYGPYPFDSAGVVLVGGESAMETQEMITFSGDFINLPGVDADYVAGVVVHELAHQWFGNAVSPRDWSNLWLNEGAATYIEQMWNVDNGYTTESSVVSGWERDDEYLRMAYGPPGAADPDAFASSNSYVCPALMLHRMRDLLGGADKVDELLAAWVVEFDNRSVERDDFVAFVNEYTGTDHTAFIDEWLDSETTPE
ncbi:peptidase M1-like protein [Stackebrandtia endophytica]|uniref:Aminopeptidase N n=1 Tax=Stackebrandtia endophytica TaxID=1496996 RepID=A0A543ASL7_9ACTN|nr:M1 family metallopeptidase [Stackebrandtia endophytica]TQL75568.1 peptidase M1-like protein [Stackebrandtia endophytica]